MAIGSTPPPAANDTSRDGMKGTKDLITQKLADYEKVKSELRELLNGRNGSDISKFEREEKGDLAVKYRQLQLFTEQLSELYVLIGDNANAEKFKNESALFSKRAKSFGSIMRESKHRITMDDVKGLKEVKEMVKTFLYMIRNPEILRAYKMEGGLGLMMYGAPGTGKTMVAEAIATELDMPLFVMTPADVFKSYVGESEQAVKRIFQEIEACADGAILFVDECESIFSKRGSDDKDYKSAVTTELLQRLNGFGVDGSKRILIGATNRPDQIDPAYLRHKRFSHMVHIEPPDAEAMREIIKGKLKDIPCEVSVEDLLCMFTANSAKGYYSAADVCGIIEEACRLAIEHLIATGSTTPIPLTLEMFEKSFAKKSPSITPEALQSYANFRASVDAI